VSLLVLGFHECSLSILMLLLAFALSTLQATQRLMGKINISLLAFEILKALSININASLFSTGNKAKKTGIGKSYLVSNSSSYVLNPLQLSDFCNSLKNRLYPYGI
jgi:hypothetical protein